MSLPVGSERGPFHDGGLFRREGNDGQGGMIREVIKDVVQEDMHLVGVLHTGGDALSLVEKFDLRFCLSGISAVYGRMNTLPCAPNDERDLKIFLEKLLQRMAASIMNGEQILFRRLCDSFKQLGEIFGGFTRESMSDVSRSCLQEVVNSFFVMMEKGSSPLNWARWISVRNIILAIVDLEDKGIVVTKEHVQNICSLLKALSSIVGGFPNSEFATFLSEVISLAKRGILGLEDLNSLFDTYLHCLFSWEKNLSHRETIECCMCIYYIVTLIDLGVSISETQTKSLLKVVRSFPYFDHWSTVEVSVHNKLIVALSVLIRANPGPSIQVSLRSRILQRILDCMEVLTRDLQGPSMSSSVGLTDSAAILSSCVYVLQDHRGDEGKPERDSIAKLIVLAKTRMMTLMDGNGPKVDPIEEKTICFAISSLVKFMKQYYRVDESFIESTWRCVLGFLKRVDVTVLCHSEVEDILSPIACLIEQHLPESLEPILEELVKVLENLKRDQGSVRHLLRISMRVVYLVRNGDCPLECVRRHLLSFWLKSYPSLEEDAGRQPDPEVCFLALCNISNLIELDILTEEWGRQAKLEKNMRTLLNQSVTHCRKGRTLESNLRDCSGLIWSAGLLSVLMPRISREQGWGRLVGPLVSRLASNNPEIEDPDRLLLGLCALGLHTEKRRQDWVSGLQSRVARTLPAMDIAIKKELEELEVKACSKREVGPFIGFAQFSVLCSFESGNSFVIRLDMDCNLDNKTLIEDSVLRSLGYKVVHILQRRLLSSGYGYPQCRWDEDFLTKCTEASGAALLSEELPEELIHVERLRSWDMEDVSGRDVEAALDLESSVLEEGLLQDKLGNLQEDKKIFLQAFIDNGQTTNSQEYEVMQNLYPENKESWPSIGLSASFLYYILLPEGFISPLGANLVADVFSEVLSSQEGDSFCTLSCSLVLVSMDKLFRGDSQGTLDTQTAQALANRCMVQISKKTRLSEEGQRRTTWEYYFSVTSFADMLDRGNIQAEHSANYDCSLILRHLVERTRESQEFDVRHFCNLIQAIGVLVCHGLLEQNEALDLLESFLKTLKECCGQSNILEAQDAPLFFIIRGLSMIADGPNASSLRAGDSPLSGLQSIASSGLQSIASNYDEEGVDVEVTKRMKQLYEEHVPGICLKTLQYRKESNEKDRPRESIYQVIEHLAQLIKKNIISQAEAGDVMRAGGEVLTELKGGCFTPELGKSAQIFLQSLPISRWRHQKFLSKSKRDSGTSQSTCGRDTDQVREVSLVEKTNGEPIGTSVSYPTRTGSDVSGVGVHRSVRIEESYGGRTSLSVEDAREVGCTSVDPPTRCGLVQNETSNQLQLGLRDEVGMKRSLPRKDGFSKQIHGTEKTFDFRTGERVAETISDAHKDFKITFLEDRTDYVAKIVYEKTRKAVVVESDKNSDKTGSVFCSIRRGITRNDNGWKVLRLKPESARLSLASIASQWVVWLLSMGYYRGECLPGLVPHSEISSLSDRESREGVAYRDRDGSHRPVKRSSGISREEDDFSSGKKKKKVRGMDDQSFRIGSLK